MNCPACPAEVWDLKGESCPLDDVGVGPKKKRAVCAGAKFIRQQDYKDWKQETRAMHQLDLIGLKVRATIGISSLAARRRVEEVAREVKKLGKRVMAYFAYMYVGKRGRMKLSVKGYIALRVYDDATKAETDTESAIWGNWRAPKRKL